MLKSVTFALEMFIRVLEECSDDALRAVGTLTREHQDAQTINCVKSIMVMLPPEPCGELIANTRLLWP